MEYKSWHNMMQLYLNGETTVEVVCAVLVAKPQDVIKFDRACMRFTRILPALEKGVFGWAGTLRLEPRRGELLRCTRP